MGIKDDLAEAANNSYTDIFLHEQDVYWYGGKYRDILGEIDNTAKSVQENFQALTVRRMDLDKLISAIEEEVEDPSSR